MLLTFKRTFLPCVLGGLSIFLSGCGLNVNNSGGGKGEGTGTTPTVTITVSVNGPASVMIGVASQYSATVSGTTNQTVNWSVNQITGGNGEIGTISSTGLYSPPVNLPPVTTISIAAASAVDSSAAQSLSVTLQAPSGPIARSVTVTGPVTVNVGTPQQYTATVAGVQDQTVSWTVNGIAGGNSTFGTITSEGFYKPPASVPSANTVVIAASSAVTPSVSGTLSTTIFQPIPVITTAVGATQNSGSTFTVDVQGSNFVSGSTLLIGGQSVTTNTVGQNDVQSTLSNPGGHSIQITLVVQNPNPGETQSSPVTITLSPPLASPIAAGRFLDQATFGPTFSSLAHVEQIGLQAAINEQFNEPTTLYSQPPVGDAECPTVNWHCTQSDFFKIAVYGKDQLRQRVAFALSELWVAPVQQSNTMPFYLNTLANDAFTNYRTIMQDATLSPTMGSYLNMLNSPKPAAGLIANENYGRELMQLFTMGLNMLNPDGSVQLDSDGNPVPTYTEAQVEAFARAFTGWTFANPDGSSPSQLTDIGNWRHLMVPVESEHDTTSKALLNGTVLPAGQTAEQDLQGALDNVFQQPNVGPFVCRHLIQHLVTGNPSPGYIQRVAAVFNDNGSGVRGDMKAVLTAILMDQEARAGDAQTGDEADSNPAVDGGHLREPLLWTTNLIRGLHATPINPSDPYPYYWLMSPGMTGQQEAPFNQPTVFNYFSPLYVIPQTNINSPEFDLENTGTTIPRMTLANQIIHNSVPYGDGLNVDLGSNSAIGQKANDPAQLIDYLGMLFMHSQMPANMRNALIAEVSSIPANALETRAQIAVYLVVTSSQYKIIH